MRVVPRACCLCCVLRLIDGRCVLVLFSSCPPSDISITHARPITIDPQAALLQAARGYASKDVRFGIECREAVLGGVNKLADAVQVTLGPKVRCLCGGYNYLLLLMRWWRSAGGSCCEGAIAAIDFRAPAVMRRLSSRPAAP